MNKRVLKLDEFIAEYPFLGDWEISYTDGTHLRENEYVKLGDITIDASAEITQDNPILPFIFKPVTSEQIKHCFSKLFKEKKQADKGKKGDNSSSSQQEFSEKQINRVTKIIRDELTDSVLRAGLLRPQFCLMEKHIIEMGFLEVMRQLSKPGHLTFVVDTSALRRAIPSFLHKTLWSIPIWTVVPVYVMAEIQQRVYDASKIWRESDGGKLPHLGKCDVLTIRPQVSCISRELSHIREWRPVEILTTVSEHLDQINIDSKNDRLIIESMKNLKRDRGLQQGIYLLTGDKDMASLVALENHASLYIDVPRLPLEMSSLRYDSHNKKYVLTPIHYLLWDLAQVFSTIRFENKQLCRKYELVYYSQARGGFFARDVMEIREE